MSWVTFLSSTRGKRKIWIPKLNTIFTALFSFLWRKEDGNTKKDSIYADISPNLKEIHISFDNFFEEVGRAIKRLTSVSYYAKINANFHFEGRLCKLAENDDAAEQ
jgi:hypothetical protein